MGPIATGLGEVYMYTVRLEHREDDKHKPGEPGQQPDGSYITPEGERLTTEEDKATYLRTAQDWIVTPLLKNTRASPVSTRSAATPSSSSSCPTCRSWPHSASR
jgi:Cu/Ag efflux pump CusA